MFGRVSSGSGNTTFADFNAKTGLFTITHKQQNADGTLREHVSANKKVSYKEEHEALLDVLVRRLMVREESDYNDPSKMNKKLWLSVRFQNGQDAIVKFSMGQFALKMLGLLNAADLTKPISLVGGAFAAGTEKTDLNTGEKTVRKDPEPFLYGAQDGVKLKAKFSDDADFKIPKVEKIEVKNPTTGIVLSTVNDPTKRDAFALELAAEMINKVSAATGTQPKINPATAPAPTPDADHTDVDGDNDSISASDVLGDAGLSDAEQFGAPAVA